MPEAGDFRLGLLGSLRREVALLGGVNELAVFSEGGGEIDRGLKGLRAEIFDDGLPDILRGLSGDPRDGLPGDVFSFAFSFSLIGWTRLLPSDGGMCSGLTVREEGERLLLAS